MDDEGGKGGEEEKEKKREVRKREEVVEEEEEQVEEECFPMSGSRVRVLLLAARLPAGGAGSTICQRAGC